MAGRMLEDTETVVQKIKEDFDVWLQVSGWVPSFPAFLRLLLFSPGFQLTILLRFQEACLRLSLLGKVLRKLLWYLTTTRFGTEISLSAKIGGGVYLPHPWGIVIGDGVVIGKKVTIFHQVTLGRADFRKKEVPVIENGAVIYAGAKIFGDVVIGEKAIIASNAVVLVSAPSGSVVAGVPARIVRSSS